MHRLKAKDEGIILERSKHSFEKQAVLNPACVEKDGILHMFYRAVRPDMVSTVGYCQLKDNKVIYRSTRPILFPEYSYEKMGVEDPRITYMDGIYYLFYVAYDGNNARTAYATSTDLVKFKKRGIISSQLRYEDAKKLFCVDSPVATRLALYKTRYKFREDPTAMLWEKDSLLFPKKIHKKYAMLTRVLPGIQIVYFNDFSELTDDIFWQDYIRNLDKYLIMEPKFIFEHKHIGGGAPPLLTKDGWLMIYHAVEDTPTQTIYHACAALLDLKDPTKVIGRLDYPLFSPSASWELVGDVDNVVFPTSVTRKRDRLYIYYGGADKLIACRSLSYRELMKALKQTRVCYTD